MTRTRWLTGLLVALLLALPFTLMAFVSGGGGSTKFSTSPTPLVADGAALGTAALPWSDLFLASGAVINVGNGEMTVTFAADSATVAGGTLVLANSGPTAPSLQWTGASGNGFGQSGGDVTYTGKFTIYRTNGTTAAMRFNASDADNFDLAGVLIFGDNNFTENARLGAETTAVLQQGADAAAAAAQTFKGPDGSGTDKAGGDMTFAAGRPTGTGTPGVLYLATSTTGGVSNSTQQALVNRVAISEAGIGMTARAFASLGTPANGTLVYCSDCDPPTLVDQTCTSAGTKTGSLAFRANGAWKCIS